MPIPASAAIRGPCAQTVAASVAARAAATAGGGRRRRGQSVPHDELVVGRGVERTGVDVISGLQLDRVVLRPAGGEAAAGYAGQPRAVQKRLAAQPETEFVRNVLVFHAKHVPT